MISVISFADNNNMKIIYAYLEEASTISFTDRQKKESRENREVLMNKIKKTWVDI